MDWDWTPACLFHRSDTWQGDAHAGHYGEEVFRELSCYHDARYSTYSRLVQ